MDNIEYNRRQEHEEAEFEARCKRCGTCCGANGTNPCANLIRDPDGKYSCKNYETRIGIQFTVDGTPFTCVPIRDLMETGLPFPDCGYNNR